MPVFRSTYDAVVAERDRLLEEKAALVEQVKRLTDTVAAANRLPQPFTQRKPPTQVSRAMGVYQLQRRLEARTRSLAQESED